MNISQIGDRIKEQRLSIGLKTQLEAANLCGISREMWGKYEGNKSFPGGEVLFAFAAAGADVQYILTGIHSNAIAEPKTAYGVSLTPRESALLDNYRHIADEGDKRVVERTAQLAVEAIKDEAEQKRKDDEERRNIDDRRSA